MEPLRTGERADDVVAALHALTERERHVLALRAQGTTIAQIARELHIEQRTVKFHLTNAYVKLSLDGLSPGQRQVALSRLPLYPAGGAEMAEVRTPTPPEARQPPWNVVTRRGVAAGLAGAAVGTVLGRWSASFNARWLGDRVTGFWRAAAGPPSSRLPAAVPSPVPAPSATRSAPSRPKPSLALALVLDRSNSMQTLAMAEPRKTRLDLAKEGALKVLDALSDGDQVGIVTFDYVARWISALHQITGPHDRQTIAGDIAAIVADGGTDIFAGMELGYTGLLRVYAPAKHMIVLSDGEQGTSMPFVPLINQMRRADVTLSTIGISTDIGSKAQQDMADWAQRGGGRFYYTDQLPELPGILGREAAQAVGIARARDAAGPGTLLG